MALIEQHTMNDKSVFSPPRVLVVEAEPALRQALMQLLIEEGYAAAGVATLDDAWAIVDFRSFALILADLIVGKSPHSFTPAHILRRHTPATPLGIVTDEEISPWDERWSAFAFSLSKPLETTRLLTEIAACLHKPFNRAQARQAEVLRRFVEAVAARGGRRLLSLCTENVRYVPPETFPRFTAGHLEGKRALEAYTSSVWQNAPHLRLEVTDIYTRPRGLALRYLRFAPTADNGWAWQEQTEVFQFVGDCISQIGLPDYEKPPLPLANHLPQVG